MAKNYFKSYIWLLETLQSRGSLTLAELQSLWLRSSVNDEGKELAPRTFANHVASIADIFGIDIECDRATNTYHISNPDEIGGSDVRNWMLEALSVNSLLNEGAGMKDRIIFENVPSSQKHLATVIQAIRDGKVLEVTYQSYSKTDQEDLILEPYCLREFKKRWYLFAHKGKDEEPHMFALDRMISAEVGGKNFKLPKKFDAHDFFSGIYGIRPYKDLKKEFVTIKVDAFQAKHFRSLPLHSSQEEIETTPEYSVFQYFLAPDYDFKQDILSFGTRVEILEPEHLRLEMKSTVEELLKKYSSPDKSHGYSVVPINSYDEVKPFAKYTDWCITVDELIFQQYGENGNNRLYVAIRDDMSYVPAIPGSSSPHDDYGYSLMAIYVRRDGKKTVTSRWNSFEEGESFVNDAELKEILGEKYNVLL